VLKKSLTTAFELILRNNDSIARPLLNHRCANWAWLDQKLRKQNALRLFPHNPPKADIRELDFLQCEDRRFATAIVYGLGSVWDFFPLRGWIALQNPYGCPCHLRMPQCRKTAGLGGRNGNQVHETGAEALDTGIEGRCLKLTQRCVEKPGSDFPISSKFI
jgi:hypothetical protein